MGHLSEIVDSLENRISKLLHRFDKLKQTNVKLEEDVTALNQKAIQNQNVIEALRQECESLKLANSILGSDQQKRETNLKINALVREIDQCVAQLSE